MFVTGHSINTSNLLSIKRHLSGLNIRPAKLKTRLLVISKLLTVFFSNCGLRCFQLCDGLWIVCKCSIAFCSFSFEMKWTVMPNSCASLYWTKIQWSTKPHWLLLSFFSPVSAVDLCSHASYQRCGKVLSTWVKIPYSSE